MSDPWNIGSLNKEAIWTFYIVSNLIGVSLCSFLIYSVWVNKNRLISDIFIVGLAFSCITMSISCAIQCLLSLITGKFYGGTIACQIEAIVHVSTIINEFFCVTALTLSYYFTIVKQRTMNEWMAIKIIFGLWLCSTIMTGLLSLVSPIYLMSAGTYCFLSFRSWGIIAWLIPVFIASLVIMIYCNIQLRLYLKKNVNTPIVAIQNGQILTHDIVKIQCKSTLFIWTVLIGFGFTAVTMIYELSSQERANEWLVTAVGVSKTSFSSFVPLVYFYSNKKRVHESY